VHLCWSRQIMDYDILRDIYGVILLVGSSYNWIFWSANCVNITDVSVKSIMPKSFYCLIQYLSQKLQMPAVYLLKFHLVSLMGHPLMHLACRPVLFSQGCKPHLLSLKVSVYGCTVLLDLDWFFSFLIYTQSVGLLGRKISPSQGRYLRKEQHNHRIHSNGHPCLDWNWNPWSHCSSGRRQLRPLSARPLWSASHVHCLH
jgi:hypothetical protein